MKTAIVAPVHIQPSERWINALLSASKGIDVMSKVDVIIVDDSNGKVMLPSEFRVCHYAWQLKTLGTQMYRKFEQFQHSSACKNFGTLLAYKEGYDTIIVIDSDCIIPPNFVRDHQQALDLKRDQWANPLEGTSWYSRGYPYHLRQVENWANMGLWTNELDLYGSDRVTALPNLPPSEPKRNSRRVAPFFPLSGMNVSFRREAIPFMLFLPNFKTDTNETFSRHDDIWGGYVFQKAAQAYHKVLTFGGPNVFHDTIVNPYEDAAEEVPMLKYEKDYYRAIDMIMGSSGNQAAWAIFDRLACNIVQWPVFRNLRPAFEFWRDSFSRS